MSRAASYSGKLSRWLKVTNWWLGLLGITGLASASVPVESPPPIAAHPAKHDLEQRVSAIRQTLDEAPRSKALRLTNNTQLAQWYNWNNWNNWGNWGNWRNWGNWGNF